MNEAPPRLVLRIATADDAAAIERFMRGLSRESRKTRFFSSMTDAAIQAETLRELGSPGGSMSVLARDATSDQIVGHAIAIHVGDGVCDIGFAVADDYQHHGIGTLLLERLMREAAACGMQALGSDVLAANHDMLHIFARAGFQLRREPGVGVVHVAAMLGCDETPGRTGL